MSYHSNNIEIILLEKTYHGFEDSYDYFRDASEVFDFPEDDLFKKIKGEFSGKLKVKVWFEPDKNDFKE